MFKQLKSALSACQPNVTDKIFATFFDCSVEYLLKRSEEALKTASSGVDVEKNLILVARLTSLARIKLKNKELAEQKANEQTEVKNSGTT